MMPFFVCWEGLFDLLYLFALVIVGFLCISAVSVACVFVILKSKCMNLDYLGWGRGEYTQVIEKCG
jgi:hypothetical protein